MSDDKAGAPPPGSDKPHVSNGTDVGPETYSTSDNYDPYADDPYGGRAASGSPPSTESSPASTAVVVASSSGGKKLPPPPPSPPDDGDAEEGGMLRMSFMEHLEELRSRIIRCLWGIAVAFLLSLIFADRLWTIISQPAVEALTFLKVNPPRLAMITPMEGFSIIWVKLPILVSIFAASPWIVYQLWAFISPGLYKRERRMAAPFIISTAGLFIAGGLFAYFLAFRYGLTFLLGIGMMNNVQPVVTITEYFDLFVNVTLGVGLVFEMPVVIFTLTLLRLASPRFLLRHSRYAILAIVIIAAIVTPTPDVFNLMLFAIPMCLLYFVGLFLGYLLVLKREGQKFPWLKTFLILLGVLIVVGAVAAVAVGHYHYHGYRFIDHWPFLTQ